MRSGSCPGVREVVIYFKFHENRSRGLGAMGGRKSPSPIDKAHGLYNSLYYRTSRDIWTAKDSQKRSIITKEVTVQKFRVR